MRSLTLASRPEHDDDLTEAEQRLQNLRHSLEAAKRAIRDAEAVLDRAERKRRSGNLPRV